MNTVDLKLWIARIKNLENWIEVNLNVKIVLKGIKEKE